MHLAAAVETRQGASPLRPCVVIAGGREPAQFTTYPGHQYLQRVGTLPCCESGGCWRSRTLPLDDGDDKDAPGQLCLDVVDGLQRCMDLITTDDVVRSIELYLAGGVARPLTSPERDGVARILTASVAVDEEPGTKPLPIWCEACQPVETTDAQPVTICVLAHGDRLDDVRRSLESIRATCSRHRYRLVVGAHGITREVRQYLYSTRLAGQIDRLHESPTDIGQPTMMRRMLACIETEYVWCPDVDSSGVDPGALGSHLALAASSGDSAIRCGGGWIARTAAMRQIDLPDRRRTESSGHAFSSTAGHGAQGT
jgi:hypothetical protein